MQNGTLTDEYGTAHDGRDTSAQSSVENDRKRLVDNDIREQKCHKHPMLALV